MNYNNCVYTFKKTKYDKKEMSERHNKQNLGHTYA